MDEYIFVFSPAIADQGTLEAKLREKNAKNLMNKLTTFTGITEFFEEHVMFSYNAYTPNSNSTSPNTQAEATKAEGVALAAYKGRYGTFPFLNVRNELVSLEGLDKILG